VPPLVELCEVVKTFRPQRRRALRSRREVTAIRGVSLEIREGEILGLVGESGSGKSTLGRCILHLETPDSGEIRFRGEALSSLTASEFRRLRRQIQMVFQDPVSSLDPRQRVRDAVEEPLRLLTDLGPTDRRDRVHRVLEEVGLTGNLAERYRHQLSGGQRQRVSIARAIVVEPSFIVLDEPVSSLDASVRGRILELLLPLHEVHRLSYLFISHDLETVRTFCDRVAIMFRGSIVELGKTSEIFERPVHPYTRLLLSSSLSADPSVRHVLRAGGDTNVAVAARRRLIEEVGCLEVAPQGAKLLRVAHEHFVAPVLSPDEDSSRSVPAVIVPQSTK
jgi:peptide/nickel transport system ATP-binding protein